MPSPVAAGAGPVAPRQRILVISGEGGSGVFAVLDTHFVGRRCQHLGTADDFDSGLDHLRLSKVDDRNVARWRNQPRNGSKHIPWGLD